jgi:crossover junction endodeoxyribonuclease RuvC
MYIWGMDLSLSNTGVAIFDEQGTPVKVFSIKTTSKDNYGVRLKIIGKILQRYKKLYPPKELIIENAFTRYNKATQVLYRLRGLVEYLFWDISQTGIAPTTMKKILTGSGKAEKSDVENSIRKLYPNIEIENDDQSDALGLGTTYFMKHEEKD